MSDDKIEKLTKMVSCIQNDISTILKRTGVAEVGTPGTPGPHWPPIDILGLIPRPIFDRATPEQQRRAEEIQLKYISAITRAFADGIGDLVKNFGPP